MMIFTWIKIKLCEWCGVFCEDYLLDSDDKVLLDNEYKPL